LFSRLLSEPRARAAEYHSRARRRARDSWRNVAFIVQGKKKPEEKKDTFTGGTLGFEAWPLLIPEKVPRRK